MPKSSAVDSSFLSITSVTPLSPKLRYQRRRPSPINLYELSTLEALPTPASSSSQVASYDSQSLDIAPPERQPRRLRKPNSATHMNGGEKKLTGFGKRKKVKDHVKAESIKQDTAFSFLPLDEDVKAPSITSTKLPAPPRSRDRPDLASLDPSIFGREIKVVKAEDPIDQVIRLHSEERVRHIQRSFAPTVELARPTSQQPGQSVAHRPTPSISGLRTGGGSTRQRHHLPMPSIQGVIEGDAIPRTRPTGSRRDTLDLPITQQPESGSNSIHRLGRHREGSIRSVRTEGGAPSPPSSPPSSPIREYLYPTPSDPPTKVAGLLPNGRPPTYFSTGGNTSPIRPLSGAQPSIDASPTLGTPALTKRERHNSLTPSTNSQSEHAWRSSRHVEPDEEHLTALEILEELNGGQEEGWEFGVLAKERSQAGLEEDDKQSKKRFGMATIPRSKRSETSTVEREGSIKDVRSWRETRKKTKDARPPSEQGRPKSIKPKRSIEGLEPLYEVSYSIEPDLARAMSPPPVPPRAAGRAVAHLKLDIERIESGKSSRSGIDVPLVLDSPVKPTRPDGTVTRVEDLPHGVSSPAQSPTPIHLRPLPPLPNLPPLGKPLKSINPLTSLKQTDGLSRLLRPKRTSGSGRPVMVPTHHSSPPTFSEQLSPLDSPPPSSPRPRLSARDEPHAGLLHRTADTSLEVDRALSRKQGMTALSFLALEDPTLSYSKAPTDLASAPNSLDLSGRRRESVQAHIVPPEELANFYHRRRSSSASESGFSRASMRTKEEILVSPERQDARMSFGLSPPPRQNRRAFEPPPLLEDGPVPLSLSPPPRSRSSLNARKQAPSPVYIDTATAYPLDSYLDISPSPSPLHFTPVTPRENMPRRLGSASSRHSNQHRDAIAPPPSAFHGYKMGTSIHGSELREVEQASQARDLDRQALSEWLAQPRARKASVPVNGISRIRPGVYV